MESVSIVRWLKDSPAASRCQALTATCRSESDLQLRRTHARNFAVTAWASAHRGKWGQLTPWKQMDEKLKSENM